MARKTIAELERKLELCQSENETLQRGGRVDADTIISQENQIEKLTEERDGARNERDAFERRMIVAEAWRAGARLVGASVQAGIDAGENASGKRAEKDAKNKD